MEERRKAVAICWAVWMLLIIWEAESLESDNLLFVEAVNKDIEYMSSVGLVKAC